MKLKLSELTHRELQIIQAALSSMYSNLDDINDYYSDCKDDFDEFTEKEVEELRDKIETNIPIWFQDTSMQGMFADFVKKGKTLEDAKNETLRRFKEYDG